LDGLAFFKIIVVGMEHEKEFCMSAESKKVLIMESLRKNGCRITNQRQILIEIILQDECSSCKEIYYQAGKVDPSIGMATVYRLVKTLEEAGLIHRKNLYRIDCEKIAEGA
jgi:Fe2+/Zn2+ uptake regulation proteins